MARPTLAPIGEELKFVVLRGGQEKTIAVRGEWEDGGRQWVESGSHRFADYLDRPRHE
jgi:hypothetical protein